MGFFDIGQGHLQVMVKVFQIFMAQKKPDLDRMRPVLKHVGDTRPS
jgi:hypothetical protein